MSDKTIVNKVTASGILRLDLLQYQPDVVFADFDIKNYLFQELVLIEKEFRIAMEAIDWEAYQGKAVSVYCSVDAIVPQWVYMLVAARLKPYAFSVIFGSEKEHHIKLWENRLLQADLTGYEGEKVAFRASEHIPEALYITATNVLAGKVASLMYGEPGLPKVIRKY